MIKNDESLATRSLLTYQKKIELWCNNNENRRLVHTIHYIRSVFKCISIFLQNRPLNMCHEFFLNILNKKIYFSGSKFQMGFIANKPFYVHEYKQKMQAIAIRSSIREIFLFLLFFFFRLDFMNERW